MPRDSDVIVFNSTETASFETIIEAAFTFTVAVSCLHLSGMAVISALFRQYNKSEAIFQWYDYFS